MLEILGSIPAGIKEEQCHTKLFKIFPSRSKIRLAVPDVWVFIRELELGSRLPYVVNCMEISVL